jgi:hypothetical protein
MWNRFSDKLATWTGSFLALLFLASPFITSFVFGYIAYHFLCKWW